MSKQNPTEKQFALIRVLIALAWADGEISNEETNFLKDFFFKFDFTGEDWAKIEMYLEDPIPPEEAENLVQDFVLRLSGSSEREEVIALLKGLMGADGIVTAEESAFIQRCTEIFRGTGPASALLGRLKGLFRETVLKPSTASKRSASNRAEELDDFLNNRILFKVRRALEREQLILEADPDQLAKAALFAGLLAHVAAAEGTVSEEALAVLGVHLQTITSFDDETIALIVSVVKESARSKLDPFRLTRTYYTGHSLAERRHLLDCLFDVAGAGGELSHVSLEGVREIAYGLKFSNRDFIDAKLEYRQRSKKG